MKTINLNVLEAAATMLVEYSEYNTTGFYFDIVKISDLEIIDLTQKEFDEARELCLQVISELENEGKEYPLSYQDLDNKLDEIIGNVKC